MERYFITDFGQTMEAKDEEEIITISIPRYGVWDSEHSKGKPQVIDTGNDLDLLKEKYNTSKVVKLGK